MRPSLALALLLAVLVVLAGVATARLGKPAANGIAPGTPGAVDIGFAQFMSLHHQQAIGMAQLMLDGRPTPLSTLARSIVGEQLLELGEMRGWLGLWNQPLEPANPRDMSWMLLGSTPPDEELTQYLLDCQRSPTGMSGLATGEEMNQLRLLEGRARDTHFLALMLAHHQGGLPMARFAATQARLPVVRELAARVVLEQSREVALILRMQEAMAAAEAQPADILPSQR